MNHNSIVQAQLHYGCIHDEGIQLMTINGSTTIVVDHIFKYTVTQHAYMIYVEAAHKRIEERYS